MMSIGLIDDEELVWTKEASESVTIAIQGHYSKVEDVMADGPELQFILHKFVNIPHVVGAHQMIWLGDMAKFIVANLAA